MLKFVNNSIKVLIIIYLKKHPDPMIYVIYADKKKGMIHKKAGLQSFWNYICWLY